MAEPTLQDVHQDETLTDFSLAYFQQPSRYVATQAFPIVNTAKSSNQYYTYTKNDLVRTDAQKRATNTESAGRSYKLSTDSYQAEVWAVHIDVSEQVRADADAALDPEEDAARVTVQDIRTRMDVEWATAAFSTAIWATESTATWNTSTGDPIGDIQTAINTINSQTGFRPNTLILGADSWYTGLWSSTAILARLPDNAPRIVTRDFIGNLFDFDRVLLAESIRFSGDEGATGSPGYIHGDHALVAYVDPGAGLREATAGKTFMWSGLTGGGGGIRTKRLDMPWKDAMPRVETDAAFDFKVVATDLGYLIKDTVS